MWLEVLLLAGVTETPAEVEKIAALARRIRPTRVQRNTVSRPPCEDYAYPVPVKRLLAYARYFQPPAQVIAESPVTTATPRRKLLVASREMFRARFNVNGDMPAADWPEIDRADVLVLDVREAKEFARGHHSRAINLPLSQLREGYADLPRDCEIWVLCEVGHRAYYATRFLSQRGYRARNLLGGYTTHKAMSAAGLVQG